MKLEAAIAEYGFAHDYTPKTRTFYAQKLGHFRAWCGEQGIDDIGQVNAPLVRRYLAFVRETPTAPPGIINQALLRIRLNAAHISTDYFKYLFALYVGSLALESVSHGAVMKNLSSVQVLKSIALPLPALDEQQSVARALSACDAMIVGLMAEASVLEELFRALLEDTMTGRLSAVPLVEAAAEVSA